MVITDLSCVCKYSWGLFVEIAWTYVGSSKTWVKDEQ